MENKQLLLSICIPTYNRARFLRTSLERFRQAITPDMSVELLVSDNFSLDETPDVVNAAIADGLKCTYIRNESNIGPDGNFLQCFHKAMGKYIWLCGDDDFLIPEKFRALYDTLASGDYGLVELGVDKTKFALSPKQFVDAGTFLSEIHVWITFMSSNIFRKEVVDKIDGEKYKESYLIQVPYFLTSATLGLPNVIYYPQVLETGADSNNNGGYNFFQVFCENLLSIIHEKVKIGKLPKKDFDNIKKTIFCNWMVGFYVRFFIYKDYGRFKIDGAKKIIFKWYGKNLYFYTRITKSWIRYSINKHLKK